MGGGGDLLGKTFYKRFQRFQNVQKLLCDF